MIFHMWPFKNYGYTVHLLTWQTVYSLIYNTTVHKQYLIRNHFVKNMCILCMEQFWPGKINSFWYVEYHLFTNML